MTELSEWAQWVVGELVHRIATQVPPDEQAGAAVAVAVAVTGNAAALADCYRRVNRCDRTHGRPGPDLTRG